MRKDPDKILLEGFLTMFDCIICFRYQRISQTTIRTSLEKQLNPRG